MTLHGALSIILNIKQGMKPQLIKKLQEVDNDVNFNSIVPFKKISTIHFARFVVADSDPNPHGAPILDRLVFTTNYDLPEENHINELVKYAGPGLWDIFSMCDGFLTGSYDSKRLADFLHTNSKKSATFYVGVGNRSVTQITQEHKLRNAVQDYLDEHCSELTTKDAATIRKSIVNHVNGMQEFAWARTPEPPASSAYKMTRGLKIAGVLLLLVILSPIIIPFVLIWWLIMLLIEISEKDVPCKLDKAHVRALVEREKAIVQTQFSAVGNVKPGWFRYRTMMFLLTLTDFLAPYLYTKGKLSGIPTVHFARWLIVNEGRQMIFLSNFDGNSEGYLRDFIHIAAKQLTLMFTHTIGYPKTRLMLLGGAKDAKGFMEWAREKQVITNVWYSAYPDVSVKNVFHNSQIRDGFYGDMTEEQARKWLQLL
ncbi:MAG: peroxidase [Flavipsychrobacter sp.]|nr:peroxidase [Flavipsychrobacter sp.]